MKSKKMLASLLAVSLVSTFALAGCGNKDDKPENGGNSGAEATGQDAEQYLNVILAQEPKSIDPSKSTDVYSSQILANTQECLTRIIQDEDGKDKIVEGMAESWETSEDQLTWTFKLRDAKWSDGEPVTAQQFEYGIKRTLAGETASSYAFLLFPIKNAAEYNSDKASAEDVGVKAIDDKTLQFTLTGPCPYFLDLTYFKVMEPQRQDIIEKHGDVYGTEAETMVFSGPFKMTEWVHNSKVELVKNENYWDAESVKLDKVTMKIIAETNSIMQELDNGGLDLAGVSKPEWIQKFNETGNFNVKKGYDGSTTYTFFNQNKEVDGQINIFSNAKVRQAFTIAMDREAKIETLRKGLGEPAYSFVPPQVQIGGEEYREKVGEMPIQKLKEKNPDPKKLLSEGLKELGLDEDPSKITVKYLYAGTDTSAKEWAEFEQQGYQKSLGINMEIEYVEWAIFQTRTDAMEYQMGSMAWGGDYNDPNTFLDFWVSDAKMVPTGWSNEEYDKCIADAAKTADPAERTKLFARAEEILTAEDAVCAPEAWRFKQTYIRKYVKGYSAALFGTPDYKYVYTEGRPSK